MGIWGSGPIALAAQQAEENKRKILYWVAPMDPTYIRDKPGKSPMGMDLVPVYADQVSAGASIKIDPVTLQNMGIQTVMAQRQTLTKKIRAVGIVTYKEPQQYSVNSKISGWVEASSRESAPWTISGNGLSRKASWLCSARRYSCWADTRSGL